MSYDWSAALVKIAEKAKDDLGNLTRAVKIELFNSVVDNTRVRTGRLKGNWNIQDGSPDRSVSGLLDPTGEIVKSKIQGGATADGKTYFTNNLPYAKKREEEDAMVGVNIARLNRIVKEAASKL